MLGSASTNSLGVVRAFGRRGIPTYLISKPIPQSSISRSRYVQAIHILPDWDKHELQKQLVKLNEKISMAEKIVVFPSNDISLLTYAEIKTQLPNKFVDCIPGRDIIELCVHKDKFYSFLSKKKIPHPVSYPAGFVEKNISQFEKYLPFPFIFKPTRTHPFVDLFSKKVLEINNQQEMRPAFRLMSKHSIEFVAQEIIPGDQFYLVYFYISSDKKTTAFTGFRKVRQSPPDYGTGSLIEAFWDESLISKTRELLNEIQYTGIGEVEYKYHPQQKEHKILEINARSVTFNRLPARLGVDLEYLYYLDAIGALEKRGVITPHHANIKWMDFTKDLNTLLRLRKEKKITLPQILTSYKNLKVEGYFAQDDWGPFSYELFLLIKSIIRRLFKKKANPSVSNKIKK